VRDNRHDSVYSFGALCAHRGVGAAIIMPAANNEAVNEHLKSGTVTRRWSLCARKSGGSSRWGPPRNWGCRDELGIFALDLGPGVGAWHGF